MKRVTKEDAERTEHIKDCPGYEDCFCFDDRISHAELHELQRAHKRYETVRRMNVQQFAAALDLNIKTNKPFDEIIDDMAPFMGVK